MASFVPETDSEDELPPGWEERATAVGRVYYASHAAQTTQWTHPRTGKKKVVCGELPYGWERKVTDDGKVLFIDHINRKTTYTDPRLAFAVEEKENVCDIRQRFDASSTALQVLHGRDLSGKVAMVTGANCGIGYETVLSFAYHGCTVVLACRDLSKAEAAMQKIKITRPNAQLEAMQLDLASLKSVKQFAKTFLLKYSSLDILILNAGVFALPFTVSQDGYEMIFQTNHLSHFYLTLLLEPALISSAVARVVVVSSESHRFSSLTRDSISESQLSPATSGQYTAIMAYNDSKLCNVLFASELDRRWREKGIQVNSVHPGNVVSSHLSRNWWFYRLLFAIVRPFTKSLQQAASTSVYCATAPELVGCGGMYFNNCCRCHPSAAADDEQLANILWEISMRMVEKVMGKVAWS